MAKVSVMWRRDLGGLGGPVEFNTSASFNQLFDQNKSELHADVVSAFRNTDLEALSKAWLTKDYTVVNSANTGHQHYHVTVCLFDVNGLRINVMHTEEHS